MSYMDLDILIKSKGYKDIRCMLYWNPRFNFSHGLRPLNNDNDVLQFAKDVIGFDVIDVYVEYNVDDPEIVNSSEESEDPVNLYTLPETDDEEVVKFSTYESGV